MRITSVRDATIAIPAPYRTAAISFDEMTASVVVVFTDAVRNGRPVLGLALDSVGRYGHGGLLRERFIPRLLAADPESYADGAGGIDPARAWAVLMRNEKPGGHGERPGAVGLLDAALWDIAAKLDGRPLWRLLADRFGVHTDGHVATYASGGHYRPERDLESLRDAVRRALDNGHDHFKIKIGAASLAADMARIEAGHELLGPGRLALDGNGGMSEAVLLEYLRALSGLEPAWLEEPVEPLDFLLHQTVAAHWPGPIATGENLFSTEDLRNLLRHAGLRPDRDLLQPDISLSYGITEFVRMLDMAAAQGWGRQSFVPHAGHLLALHAVAGFGLGRFETAADTAGPFGGFPEGIAVRDGRVFAGEAPGVGFEATPHLLRLFAPVLP
ncbi:enolase C-terminal domain-like protein [Roseomonas sp. BN140053]|uniref:enolase C-terminal domain-like protein n=1 Tax=Roseomonas sp. BN140053 TaxID=3391898 RepID=UPI0039E73F8C